MTSRRSSLLASILGVVVLAVAVPARSQSYGLGDQVLAIGATEFHPQVSTASYGFYAPNGYLYLYSDGGSFYAPLTLPEGAEIFQVCLYADIPNDSAEVAAELFAAKLAPTPGGSSEGVVEVPGSLMVDNIATGHSSVCTAPFSYIFHETADVDNDGITEHVAHFFRADFLNGGLGGVRVFWRRQVSPAPATATFNDVPTTDPAFQYIEALAASGITAGCAGGNFCPNAPLTRRQMAVFLAKALGLHWAN